MCKKVRNFAILIVKCCKVLKFLSFRVQGIEKCHPLGSGRLKYSTVFEFVYVRKMEMSPSWEWKVEVFVGF